MGIGWTRGGGSVEWGAGAPYAFLINGIIVVPGARG
jgi:hypothetical protein